MKGLGLQPSTPIGQRSKWTKFGDMFGSDPTTPEEICTNDTGLSASHSIYSRDSTTDTIWSGSLEPPEKEFEELRLPSTVTSKQQLLSLDVVPGTDHATSTDAIPTCENIIVELPQSTLSNPRSLYRGFDPGAPIASEPVAMIALLDVLKQRTPDLDGFVEIDLSNFTIYLDSGIYPNEMRPLQHLATRAASDKFYFDGILSVGDKKFFLKKIPFRELPIGNYDDEEHSVDDQIWIRSELNHRKEIYYKLQKPSLEYARFWTPFLWIADLAKHVVDYCSHLLDKKRRARLDDFRERFSDYVLSKHGKVVSFQHWYAAHGSRDFRTAVVANIEFLWKEALGLPLPVRKIATWHEFWAQIRGGYYSPMVSSLSLRPTEESTDEDNTTPGRGTKRTRKGKGEEKIAETIVTPYIYDLFSHMGFDNIMESVPLATSVYTHQLKQLQYTSCTQQNFHRGSNRDRNDQDFLAKIEAGDVISTPPDEEETGTKWKRETSRHHDSDYVWYGMVQKVHISPVGHRAFDVIWMYQPRDTPCALMKYPWPNELFLSDTCTCKTARIDQQDVLATHRVSWFGDSNSIMPTEFFVRQTYLAGERCWVALNEDHLACDHHKLIKHRSEQRKYKQGDTVLAKLPKRTCLDAFVVDTVYRENRKRWARLRRLLRRNDVDKTRHHPVNELIYTDQLVEIDSKRIVRHCVVRAFRMGDVVSAPYNRGGTGDTFYLTHRQTRDEVDRLEPIDDVISLAFRQGFGPDDTSTPQKLRGLDLFCGGGNFGRGIEDGGGVQMKWANDISSNAIHSYMANCVSGTCTPFLGSVDDLLQRALTGCPDTPQPGDVQFISGGSPCQGFSRLTKVQDQKSLKQWKNRSLVASFASFVDFYRPQYGLLENVQSMVMARDKRDECFFSQLVCSIVGLGYQVRIIYADAWSYGAPQSRCRVFLSFAAPGVKMPKAPALTHSHPPGTNMGSLGKMSNGQPFGERLHTPTPFKFVSCSEAAGQLPDIRDGKADYCVGHPDHRISIGFTPRIRNQIRQIPIQPYGLSFNRAYFGYDENGKHFAGTIAPADRDYYFPNPKEFRMQPGSKGWGRVDPRGLFRTVVTVCGPTDRKTGFVNHWRQPRPLSLLEVRRAQGFLDHEVITGKPAQQWHIVGNSVARQVALALGLSIREAWFGTLHDDSFTKKVDVQALDEMPAISDDLRDDTSLAEGIIEDDGGAMKTWARDPMAHLIDDPVSTPATSVDDPQDEAFHIRRKSGHKRHKTKSTVMDFPAKKLRLTFDGA
ncbi:cytosine-specific methyltransferase [Seiridium cupressi]